MLGVSVVAEGIIAGSVGAAVMTLTEKVEQRLLPPQLLCPGGDVGSSDRHLR